MNITGKTRIFKNDYGYSTAISKKNQDGNYEKMYISVQFPKNVELENNADIEIIKGFLSFYKDKNNLSKIKYVIQEFTTGAEKQYIEQERKAIQNEDSYQLSDDELPF